MRKCPACGFASTGSDTCPQCGRQFSQAERQGSDRPVNRSGRSATRAPDRPPEWRREVAEKVKAYGERKKNLITPPRPLKEEDETPEPRPVRRSDTRSIIALEEAPFAHRELAAVAVEDEQPLYQEPEPSIRQEELPENIFVEERLESIPERLSPRRALRERSEVKQIVSEEKQPLRPRLITPVPDNFAEDLHAALLESRDRNESARLFLARRALSFAVDSTILVVLLVAGLYAVSWYTGKATAALIAEHRLRVALGALALHMAYYLYFYSTSRQTPGYVFFALELRSAGSRNVPFFRVLLRWAATVLLNIFNIIPALSGKQALMMDTISGTEIRSLK